MNRQPSINHICPLFTSPSFVNIVPSHGIAWQKMIANDRRSMPQILPRHGSDPRLLTVLYRKERNWWGRLLQIFPDDEIGARVSRIQGKSNEVRWRMVHTALFRRRRHGDRRLQCTVQTGIPMDIRFVPRLTFEMAHPLTTALRAKVGN